MKSIQYRAWASLPLYFTPTANRCSLVSVVFCGSTPHTTKDYRCTATKDYSDKRTKASGGNEGINTTAGSHKHNSTAARPHYELSHSCITCNMQSHKLMPLPSTSIGEGKSDHPMLAGK